MKDFFFLFSKGREIVGLQELILKNGDLMLMLFRRFSILDMDLGTFYFLSLRPPRMQD